MEGYNAENIKITENFIMEHTNTGREKAMEAQSVEDIIQLLDNYTASGGSRLKLKVVEGDGSVISKQYHHGRCDVGSPWAKGEHFDVLETEE